MKKSFLLLITLILFVSSFTYLVTSRITNLSNASKGYIVYNKQQISIPTEQFLRIRSTMNFSILYCDTPSCPIDEGFQLVFMKEDDLIKRFLIGKDACGTFFDIESGLYIEGKKDAKKIIDEIIVSLK